MVATSIGGMGQCWLEPGNAGCQREVGKICLCPINCLAVQFCNRVFGLMRANTGYFILTDISGYTAFLTGSELDHAQDALQNLFDVQWKSIFSFMLRLNLLLLRRMPDQAHSKKRI